MTCRLRFYVPRRWYAALKFRLLCCTVWFPFCLAMDDVSLVALTHALLLRLARRPLPHRHLARLWHVSLRELEDLHLAPWKISSLAYSFFALKFAQNMCWSMFDFLRSWLDRMKVIWHWAKSVASCRPSECLAFVLLICPNMLGFWEMLGRTIRLLVASFRLICKPQCSHSSDDFIGDSLARWWWAKTRMVCCLKRLMT